MRTSIIEPAKIGFTWWWVAFYYNSSYIHHVNNHLLDEYAALHFWYVLCGMVIILGWGIFAILSSHDRNYRRVSLLPTPFLDSAIRPFQLFSFLCLKATINPNICMCQEGSFHAQYGVEMQKFDLQSSTTKRKIHKNLNINNQLMNKLQ